jgi:glycosyltransferase involved in cell wall biosynthesis
MPKLIYAWNYREWGGAQIYLLSLIKEARHRHDITAVLPENSEARLVKELRELGVEPVFSPPVPRLVQPDGLLESLSSRAKLFWSEWKFVDVVLREIGPGPSIVHVELGFWQSAWQLWRLCRSTDVFVTHHTSLDRQPLLRDVWWKIKGHFASRTEKLHVLTSNEDARRSFAGYLSRRAFGEIKVTYAGFDPSEIETVEATFPGVHSVTDKYRLPTGTLAVTVGQFIERKGCWVVAEAVAELIGNGNGLTFLWLATARPDDNQMARLASFGLGERFRVLSSDDLGGTRDELLTIVRAADVFVLASQQEGLPIALVEAMALGRACLATNVNAIPEAINNGVSGVLISANDAGRLARELESLLADEKRRRHLGANARAAAYKSFDERVTARTTLDLYEAVWKTRR